MKSSAILVVVWWATLSLGSVVRTTPRQTTPAIVSLGSTRSANQPLRLQVEAFNEKHDLKLVPAASPLSSNFKLQTLTRDEQGSVLIRNVEAQTVALYENPETSSVVSVNGDTVEGIISSTLSLRAASDGSHEAIRQEKPVAVPSASTHDYLELPDGVRKNEGHVGDTRATVAVSPEIYIIVDSTLATLLGTDAKVTEYLSVFWNAVNQRFATITNPKINLVLSGALIVRDSSSESYISDNILLSKYIHGENTLNSVSDWLYENQNQLPTYDIAYLMTGKDMADVKDGLIQPGLAGIAWLGAACIVATWNKRSFNTGMGEDIDGYYSGVMTAAHEVAHNLGAPHDGSGTASDCSWDDGYLMSYVSGSSNKLFFSTCSQKQMLSYVTTADATCLSTTAPGANNIGLSSQLPGDVYTMDQQCQKFTGQSGAYPSKSESEDSLCVQLVCQWNEQNGYYIYTYTKYTGRPAAEGTPCKSGGKCTNGSCQ